MLVGVALQRKSPAHTQRPLAREHAPPPAHNLTLTLARTHLYAFRSSSGEQSGATPSSE